MSCVLKETWVHCMKWVPHVKLIFLCSILFVVSWVYNESLASGGSHQNLHELSQDVPQRGRRRHVRGSQNSGRNPYLTYFIHSYMWFTKYAERFGSFLFWIYFSSPEQMAQVSLEKRGLYYFMIDMVLYFMLVYLFKLFRTELLSLFVI